MKIGVIGAGRVGSAALLSVVLRGCAREIVVVNRDRKRAAAVATDLRYGATLSPVVDIRDAVRYANITIIEGNQASQYGIGMVSARIAEMVLRDERAVIPIGSYNPAYGATLSMPSVLGRAGVVQILEPELSEEERQALDRSAERLRDAVAGLQVSGAHA